MKRTLAAGLVGLGLLPASALAQTPVLPFPLRPTAAEADMGELRAAPERATIDALTRLERVRLAGAALPTGEIVDLELERISVERRKFGYFVDGVARPRLLDGLGLSVWKGNVAGDASREVMLGFSVHGATGWIRGANDLVHVIAQPDAAGDWLAGDVLLVTEGSLVARGSSLPGNFCLEEDFRPRDGGNVPPVPKTGPGIPVGGACNLRECTIAMETDWQYFQQFNDLGAVTTYTTTLLSFISDRYETQASTVLTFPYLQFYTSSNDPWSVPDQAGQPGINQLDLLDELIAAWQGNVPMGATLGHIISGAGLGGGVAYLDALCSTSFNFGASANLDGNVNFPVQQQPNNWDFIVVAHEIGHNFASPHTHDYCPPLDECPSSQYWGQCQDQQTCLNDGTIMSYCHLCPGGTGNITTFFHPTAAGVMTNAAAGCLPLYSGVSAVTIPDLLTPGTPETVTVEIAGTIVGAVELRYSYDNGQSYSSVAMTNTSGDTWSADLPPAACDDAARYYVAFDEAQCGPTTLPDNAPSAYFTAEIGQPTLVLEDDFESAGGWSAGAPGDDATTGLWERGNPNGTAAQPEDDHTVPGTDCWFTGQAAPGAGVGDNDVDGGRTTLLSPVFDLSNVPSPRVSYWRWYSNQEGASPGADVFEVDISDDGGSSWTNVETVGPSGAGTAGGWIEHSFLVTDFVAGTSQVRMRFVASDEGSGSIVEAAVDDLRIEGLTCSSATAFCFGDGTGAACPCGNTGQLGAGCANSTGSGAILEATGLASVSSDDLMLSGYLMPSTAPALYFQGTTQENGGLGNAFGDGLRCAGGTIIRLGTQTNFGGSSSYPSGGDLPISVKGAVSPGDTRTYQTWYRNVAGPCGQAFNLTNGLSVEWAP